MQLCGMNIREAVWGLSSFLASMKLSSASCAILPASLLFTTLFVGLSSKDFRSRYFLRQRNQRSGFWRCFIPAEIPLVGGHDNSRQFARLTGR